MSSKINLQTCEYARKSSIFQDNQLILLDNVLILVKDMYNTVVVKIQQILYIYSNARKRCLVTLDGEIETWEQLKSIYEKLPQEQFAYAQKGFVVNYKMIKKLNKTGVELVNGENVPISRGMKNEFFANYFEFLGK